MTLSTSPSERPQSRWQTLATSVTEPTLFFAEMGRIVSSLGLSIKSEKDLQSIVDEINKMLHVENQSYVVTETGAEPPRLLWPAMNTQSEEAYTLIADLQPVEAGSFRIKKLSVLGPALPLATAKEDLVRPAPMMSAVVAEISNAYYVSQSVLQSLASEMGGAAFGMAVQFAKLSLERPITDQTRSQVQVIPLVIEGHAVSLCIDAIGSKDTREIFDISIRKGVLPAHERIIEQTRARLGVADVLESTAVGESANATSAAEVSLPLAIDAGIDDQYTFAAANGSDNTSLDDSADDDQLKLVLTMSGWEKALADDNIELGGTLLTELGTTDGSQIAAGDAEVGSAPLAGTDTTNSNQIAAPLTDAVVFLPELVPTVEVGVVPPFSSSQLETPSTEPEEGGVPLPYNGPEFAASVSDAIDAQTLERNRVGEAAVKLSIESIFPILARMYGSAQLNNQFHQDQLRSGLIAAQNIRSRLTGLQTKSPITADNLDQLEKSNAGVYDFGEEDTAGNPLIATFLNLNHAQALFAPLLAIPSGNRPFTEEQYAAWFALVDVIARYTFIDYHRRSKIHKEGVAPEAQWFAEMITAVDKYIAWRTIELNVTDEAKEIAMKKFILPGTNEDLQSTCSIDQLRGHTVANRLIGWIDRTIAQDYNRVHTVLATLRTAPIASAIGYFQSPTFQESLEA